jgi:hypothetical protein
MRQPEEVLKKKLKTAPYGRGLESVLSVYSNILSRDHRERFSALFQHRLKAAPRFDLRHVYALMLRKKPASAMASFS